MFTRWNELGLGRLDRGFLGLGDLRREMDRLLFDFERDRLAPERGLRFSPRSHWPRVSLHDHGSELHVRAEVPGLSDKDIELTVEQSSLTIRGARKVETPDGYSVHRQERGDATFAQSFALPCRVDSEKATAKLVDGVLDVLLPKVAEERPRQISVRATQ